MEIQRHCVCASGYGEGYLVPHPLGEAVLYDDHIEEIEKLKLELKKTRELADSWYDAYVRANGGWK